MRIGIVTQPLRYNYGCILQNYALQLVLKRMGHQVVTLDGEVKTKHTLKRKLFILARNFFLFLRDGNKKILGIIPFQTTDEILSQNLNDFIRNNINKQKLSSYRANKFDALIVGSDQVWRPSYSNLEEAYLEFAKNDNILKIAYAASFGSDSWEYSLKETIKYAKLAKLFDAISVREESGIVLCEKYLNVNCCQVLDPTMLLTKEDYILNMDILSVEKSQGEIFYYFLDDNGFKQNVVNRISLIFGKKSFTVNSKVENVKARIDERIQPPIEKWLRAFHDAFFIVTDSFHGCVFSLLFNKPFILIANKKRGLARFYSLFNQLNIVNRIVEEGSDFKIECFLKEPNVDLSILRQKSYNFLNKYFL